MLHRRYTGTVFSGTRLRTAFNAGSTVPTDVARTMKKAARKLFKPLAVRETECVLLALYHGLPVDVVCPLPQIPISDYFDFLTEIEVYRNIFDKRCMRVSIYRRVRTHQTQMTASDIKKCQVLLT